MKSLNIQWKQENNLSLLILDTNVFYFESPDGYNIENVDNNLKELALFFLLYQSGYYNIVGNKEVPNRIFNNDEPLLNNNSK